MSDKLSKEELKFLKPFKKVPKTRAGYEFAFHIEEVNRRLQESNELDDYVRKPLGTR